MPAFCAQRRYSLLTGRVKQCTHTSGFLRGVVDLFGGNVLFDSGKGKPMSFLPNPPGIHSSKLTMTRNDFEIAVGEAAQNAVWNTPHPLTHHLAEDDPRRVQYLREYQQSVGCQVIAAIVALRATACRNKRRQGVRAALVDPADTVRAYRDSRS